MEFLFFVWMPFLVVVFLWAGFKCLQEGYNLYSIFTKGNHHD